MIENLKWSNKEKNIEWTVGKDTMKIETELPPFSVILTEDCNNLAIVFSNEEYGNENAYLYSFDGNNCIKLVHPQSIRDVICFHEIYYISGKLTAIIATSHCDFACEIDEKTGEIEKVYETR